MSGRAGRKYRIRKRRRIHRAHMLGAQQDFDNFMEALYILLESDLAGSIGVKMGPAEFRIRG